jgi:hypothetical protein
MNNLVGQKTTIHVRSIEDDIEPFNREVLITSCEKVMFEGELCYELNFITTSKPNITGAFHVAVNTVRKDKIKEIFDDSL